jgi:hypothetical protein
MTRDASLPLDAVTEDAPLVQTLSYAFAPLDKSAFGVATGVAGAILIAAITTICLLLPRASSFPAQLLNEYFAGYTVSWTGVVVGAVWGFVVGFTAGWFLAFCRNVVLAVSALTLRVRVELSQTRDFLDHI